MRCLLGRRRRNREIEPRLEKRMVAEFEHDIARGILEVYPLLDQHAIRARQILERLANIPLRTLDALHLAIATEIAADAMATADRTFAASARALRLRVEWFGEGAPGRRR
jgi:uncharacterized protein